MRWHIEVVRLSNLQNFGLQFLVELHFIGVCLTINVLGDELA
jgi:hypothetical protein